MFQAPFNSRYSHHHHHRRRRRHHHHHHRHHNHHYHNRYRYYSKLTSHLNIQEVVPTSYRLLKILRSLGGLSNRNMEPSLKRRLITIYLKKISHVDVKFYDWNSLITLSYITMTTLTLIINSLAKCFSRGQFPILSEASSILSMIMIVGMLYYSLFFSLRWVYFNYLCEQVVFAYP